MGASWKRLLAPAVQWATDEGILSKTEAGRRLKQLGKDLAETVGILESAERSYERPWPSSGPMDLGPRAHERERQRAQHPPPATATPPAPVTSGPISGNGLDSSGMPPIRAKVRLFTRKSQPACQPAREYLTQLG